MKIIIVAAFVAAVLVPAALAAESTAPQSSSAFCKSVPVQLTIGTTAGKLYKNFGACVSHQNTVAETSALNAAKACKAERALTDTQFMASHSTGTPAVAGTKTFAQFYGTNGANGNGKSSGSGNGNALGKCVSLKANAQTAAAQTAEVKGAKACRTDAVLKAKIASKIYKNFGACVSAQGKPVS